MADNVVVTGRRGRRIDNPNMAEPGPSIFGKLIISSALTALFRADLENPIAPLTVPPPDLATAFW